MSAIASLPVKVVRDWQPTGNINFVVPDALVDDYKTRAMFFLETEEDRVIELVGGGESREIRFRMATLHEAISVVKSYMSNPEYKIKPEIGHERGLDRPSADARTLADADQGAVTTTPNSPP
jgi:hypothetical protein